MHPFIETQKEWLRKDLPPFRAGDTLRVNVRVREGDKERLQAFEGICIARRGSGVSESFTVRKISNGVGVERIFPVHSPMIADILVVRRGRVRRAKLYYLRHLAGRQRASERRRCGSSSRPPKCLMVGAREGSIRSTRPAAARLTNGSAPLELHRESVAP